MAKNLMPEVARMLGVKVGEKFKIKGNEGLTYRFNDDELIFNDDNDAKIYNASSVTFTELLNGKMEIVKLPWRPKEGEAFYSFYIDVLSLCCGDRIWKVKVWPWDNNPANVAMLRAGWVYKTREEAEAALPKVAAEMGVQYEL